MGRISRGISERYIGFRVPESIYKSISVEADKQGIKKAEVIRRAVCAYFGDIAGLVKEQDETSLKELKQYKASIQASMAGLDGMLRALKERDTQASEAIHLIEGAITEQVKKVYGQ